MILHNRSQRSMKLYVEPWGEEYPFQPGTRVRVEGSGPKGGELELEWTDEHVTVHGWSGSTVKVEALGD